jgi:Uma2 family endonuclease
MSIVSTTKMTARQFLELGEDPPGVRLELVNGEVAVSPSPIPAHAYTVLRLGALLLGHVERRKLGRVYPDVDTIFGEHDVRRPDLLYFKTSRLHLIGKKAMEGPPDLCVEVLSPSSGTIDRRDKFKQYALGNVRFYWIVDPSNHLIEGHTLTQRNYKLSGKAKKSEIVTLPPFKDLRIHLAKIWQPD